jgi:beta-glucanase (GH16 family)
MKTIAISLLGIVATATAATAQAIPGRTLLWADEFTQADGTKPDSTKWGNDIGGSGWGNNELQYYTDRTENARIEGGQLVIEARKENFGGKSYTSARLLTKNKVSWTYGRIEARIKIPKGQGIWPAFWMLGANIDGVGWPLCGEIDIMENIGSLPSTLYGTLHGPGYSGGGGISGNTVLAGAALGDDFHVYAIEWEENRIRWFLDGQQFFSLTPANLPGGSAWVFNAPQFLILNVAVGGNWPGSPNASTVFPQRMTVDYVRVYAPVTVSTPPTTLTVDPAEEWLGYMNVSELPANGGGYLSGGTWNVADLRTSFSGSTLTLSPTTINDPAPYWYIGGGAPGRPGNKIMGANMYVQKTGSLSGKTITFTGTVTANTLTSAHSSVAFIKDFAADYSSFTSTTAPLVNGVFSISHVTAPGSGRHVQYGFETTGVNVWPTDAASFGSVQIAPFTATPFSTWMAGLDFAGPPAPDLSAAGDPDRDGRSNFQEFALNDNPRSAAVSGKVRSRIEPVAGGKALVITLPVRGNPVFSGAPGKSATVDQVTYHIEGSNGLAVFDQNVTEIPPSAAGMPTLDAGWSYRSFRLAGDVGGTPSRGPAGYLRVRMTEVP